MTPLRDWIIVSPIKEEAGSIILLKEETPNKCLVAKVGKDVKEVKPGDTVIVKALGYSYKVGDEEIWLIQESDIYAKA